MTPREVQPELLDQLPSDDPVAERIHRDILRYNRMMGNFRWICSSLKQCLRPGDRVLEIAAGQGHLLKDLSAEGMIERAGRVVAFDAACRRPAGCPGEVEWMVCQAEEFDDYQNFDVILICHFLHQMSEEALEALGKQLGGARLILAAETRRHPLAKGLCRASRLIGFSPEGIGDGLKSIEAGFRGDELSSLLQMEEDSWRFNINETLLGSYRLKAERMG